MVKKVKQYFYKLETKRRRKNNEKNVRRNKQEKIQGKNSWNKQKQTKNN